MEKIYLPLRDYDDLDFPKQGGIWQGQLHIYQMPFYYIDYTLAQICAFQFWSKFNQNRETAWKDYLKLCKAGGSRSFLELLKIADLKSPFEPGILANVVSEIWEWLNSVDVKKI